MSWYSGCFYFLSPISSPILLIWLAINQIVTMISIIPETKPNIMIIGTGPHVHKTYVPHLQLLEAKHGPMIQVLVDIEEKRDSVTEWAAKVCPGVHLQFVPIFTDLMPSRARAELDEIAARFHINGIIIATEPLSHQAYALWDWTMDFTL
jgi:hypothetical protein